MKASAETSQHNGGHRPPSRGHAITLTLLLGAAVDFLYLGRWRQALLWGALPSVVLFTFWLVMASARIHSLYAFFVPSISLTPLARGLATVAIARVPKRDFRRVPTWWLPTIWLAMVASVFLGSRLFRAYVGQAFKSGSMLPSLAPRDRVFVSEVFGRHPKRGELIAYVDPERAGDSFIKRVIALGGEGIEFKDGRPWINGWQVPHCTVAADRQKRNGGPGKEPAVFSSAGTPVSGFGVGAPKSEGGAPLNSLQRGGS